MSTFKLALGVMGALMAGPLGAQTAAESGTNQRALEEVVVTGTRLTSGFNTPTPVTAIGAQELMDVAPNNIADALQELPALANSTPNSAGGTGSGNSGTNGQSILNLRGMGQNRTLVLLDGQRMGVTNVQNSVDINMIPQAILRRVDIVTGGASASYGSDAVAGVVNFVLDTEFEGIKLDFSGGVSDKSDSESGHLSFAFGHHFGDRTRLVGALDYYDMAGLGMEPSGRDWRDDPYVAFNSGGIIQVVPHARSADASAGGLIRSVSGCQTQACEDLAYTHFVDGQVLPFDRGTIRSSRFQSGGDGSLPINGIIPDIKRESLFAHLEHDVTSNTTVWAQASYNHNDTDLDAQPVRTNGGNSFTIYEGNPFLPQSIQDIFAADPGENSFRMGRLFYEGLDHVIVNGDVETNRFAAGVKGDVNANWSWDVGAAYQDSHQDLDLHNVLAREQYAAADVVLDGSGNPVCRSTYLFGADPGCVPMDLFSDEAAVSQAANDYMMHDNEADIDIQQFSLDLNLRGDFGSNFGLEAGPVSFATGMSFRRITAERTVDDLSQAVVNPDDIRGLPNGYRGRIGPHQYYNPAPLGGEVSVTEAYVEFGIPLLVDAALAQSLDLNIAGRSTNYSQSGVQNTSKIGLNWAINDSVRFRGTVSRDIRAPSTLELFETGAAVVGRSIFPNSNPDDFEFQAPGLGRNISQGNPNLDPEKADTVTAGLVITPASWSGFSAAIDYYKIDITDAIVERDAQEVVDLCYAGDRTACGFIIVDGEPTTTTVGLDPNSVIDIYETLFNIAEETTSGMDFEIAYNTDIGPGSLRTRFLATKLIDFDNGDTGCDPASQVGAISGFGGCGVHPEWLAQLNLQYDVGDFGMNIRQRYIDGGMVNTAWTEGVDITRNNVPSVSYTDLRLSYNLGDVFGGGQGSVYFNASNIFDKWPPVATAGARSWVVPTANGLYDIIGRRYVLGLRVNW